MGEPLLSLSGIRKAFFGVEVLRGVGFSLRAGQVLGLVGENGAGKSTLMNILGGVLSPDAGEMTLGQAAYTPRSPADARAGGVAFIHQELNLFSNLTVAENVFIGELPRRFSFLPASPFLDRAALRKRTLPLLAAVELAVSPDAQVGELSPGERQLVEIAKALAFDARVVIFDEPTTSLTVRETERLFALIERLRAEGRAVIYISHALGDVMRLCDEVLVLRDGAVVAQGAKRDFSIQTMVQAMVGRALDQMFPERHAPPDPQAKALLQVRGLSRAGLIKDVSFDLGAGEVLGIAGLLGAGRSELARIVFGLEDADAGSVILDGKALSRRSPAACLDAGMAFLPEDRRGEGLLMDEGVRANVALAALPRFARTRMSALDTARLGAEVDAVARSVGVAEAKLDTEAVRALSGGNQQKVVLGRCLLTRPRVLILDEPTRGVDVGARYEIYERINALVATGAGVIVISSELEELLGLCDRILVMHKGEVAGVLPRAEFDRARILHLAFAGRQAA